MPKAALCFLISYDNTIAKEAIWKEWIHELNDHVNVYIHYNPRIQLRSPWVIQHAMPRQLLASTSYYNVVPAYLSILRYAMSQDDENVWFCMLTESCAPCVAPKDFVKLLEKYANQSIIKWSPPWWNVQFSKRANLRYINPDLHMGNDPWFVITREDAKICVAFPQKHTELYNIIQRGEIANESIFAIMLRYYKRLRFVVNKSTHITDWSRMSSRTSPYVFVTENKYDYDYIIKQKMTNEHVMFVRKIHEKFPDTLLRRIIGLKDTT